MLLLSFFHNRKQPQVAVCSQSHTLLALVLGSIAATPSLLSRPRCQSPHEQSLDHCSLLTYPVPLMHSEIRFALIMKTAHCPSVSCHHSCQHVPFRMDLGLWPPPITWPVSLCKLSGWNCWSPRLPSNSRWLASTTVLRFLSYFHTCQTCP